MQFDANAMLKLVQKLTEKDGIIVSSDTKVLNSNGSHGNDRINLDYTTLGLTNGIHNGVYKAEKK